MTDTILKKGDLVILRGYGEKNVGIVIDNKNDSKKTSYRNYFNLKIYWIREKIIRYDSANNLFCLNKQQGEK